jgi:GTP-binding protein
MSLSILIETMRREGYEFQVSPPRVLYQDHRRQEVRAYRALVVDVPADCVGSVIEKLGSRKAELLEMTPVGSRMKVEFLVPSRGLFGYRNEFMTDTKGEGIMASVFEKYAPYKGDIAPQHRLPHRLRDRRLRHLRPLCNAQERGALFIGAGVPGLRAAWWWASAPSCEDITVNVCRKKQLTNTRAAGSDDALRLIPPKQMSLEQCLEFLADDELLEVTPQNLRLRKSILNTSSA